MRQQRISRPVSQPVSHRVSHRASRRASGTLAAAAIAALPAVASADLIVDVRISSASPGVTIHNPKLATPTSIGDVITMGVWARVSGTNGINDERMGDATGSAASDVGPILGNLLNTTVAPFNAASSQNGTVQDFDSDGDLDVGSLGTTSAGKIVYRSASSTALPNIVDSNTAEIQMGTLIFTLTSGGLGTSINFIPRPGTSAGVANWSEDNIATSKTVTTGTYAAGTPVVLIVPEPTSAALLSVASLALIRRRHR